MAEIIVLTKRTGGMTHGRTLATGTKQKRSKSRIAKNIAKIILHGVVNALILFSAILIGAFAFVELAYGNITQMEASGLFAVSMLMVLPIGMRRKQPGKN